jgi:hypothetical protein
VDLYDKPELLFLGPDGVWSSLLSSEDQRLIDGIHFCFAEGTADMMDWAAREYIFFCDVILVVLMIVVCCSPCA